MGIILFLVIGAVAGWLAGMIMKGRGFGILGNIIVGIIGTDQKVVDEWAASSVEFFASVQSNKSFNLTRPLVTHRAGARPAPIALSG